MFKTRIPNWPYEHAGDFCQEPFTEIENVELALLQIRVTTEEIFKHRESSANESEYELHKVSSLPKSCPNEVREDNRSPDRKE